MAAVPGTCFHQCEVRSASPCGHGYCRESMLLQCLCHLGTTAIPRYSAGNWKEHLDFGSKAPSSPGWCCALCYSVPWTFIHSLSSKGMNRKTDNVFSFTLHFSSLFCFNSTSRVFPSILIPVLPFPPGCMVRWALPGCQGGAVAGVLPVTLYMPTCLFHPF